MGTHASAKVFYGIAWPSEELPEQWAKAQQERWDANDFDTEDEDPSERLESLLKELGLDGLLEADFHGNLQYDCTGYAIQVTGTSTHVGCGDVEKATASTEISAEATAALQTVLEHLGSEGAEVGWLVTVTYG